MPTGNAVLQVYPPAYNFQQLQMANISLVLPGGVPWPWFSALEYNDTVDVEEGRGASPYPMGTTQGSYKASGSIDVHATRDREFLDKIRLFSPSGRSIYDAVFDLVAQWQLRAAPGLAQPPVVTDEILGCRVTSSGVTLSAGPGVFVVKHSLYIGLIKRDGLMPLDGLPA